MKITLFSVTAYSTNCFYQINQICTVHIIYCMDYTPSYKQITTTYLRIYLCGLISSLRLYFTQAFPFLTKTNHFENDTKATYTLPPSSIPCPFDKLQPKPQRHPLRLPSHLPTPSMNNNNTQWGHVSGRPQQHASHHLSSITPLASAIYTPPNDKRANTVWTAPLQIQQPSILCHAGKYKKFESGRTMDISDQALQTSSTLPSSKITLRAFDSLYEGGVPQGPNSYHTAISTPQTRVLEREPTSLLLANRSQRKGVVEHLLQDKLILLPSYDTPSLSHNIPVSRKYLPFSFNQFYNKSKSQDKLLLCLPEIAIRGEGQCPIGDQELNLRGTLYGAGTAVPNDEHTPPTNINKPPLPITTLLNTGVVRVATPQSTYNSWSPPHLPLVSALTHPILDLLDSTHLQNIKDYCTQPSDNIIVYSAKHPEVYIQTYHLREVISHGKSINDEVFALFLEISCSANNHAFLCPQFIPLLKSNGLDTTTQYFADPLRGKNRSTFRPLMSGESAIAIPCYLHNCHWVALVRREIGRRVTFCYSDDLNCPSTETEMRHLLANNTCPRFFPRHGRWIKCKSFTYSPHSNECGARTLFAISIMMAHPTPNENMLLQYMHPNLAQLTRFWIAATLLSGAPIFPRESQEMAPHDMLSPMVAQSHPYSIIQWASTQMDHPGPIPLTHINGSAHGNICPILKNSHPILTQSLSPHMQVNRPLTYFNPYNRNKDKTTTARPSSNHIAVASPLRKFLQKVENSQNHNPTAKRHTITPSHKETLPNIQITQRKSASPSKRESRKRQCIPMTPIPEHVGFSRQPIYPIDDEPWGTLQKESTPQQFLGYFFKTPMD
jgi:hypothetical protein